MPFPYDHFRKWHFFLKKLCFIMIETIPNIYKGKMKRGAPMSNSKKSPASLITIAFIVLCLSNFLPNYAQYQISPLGPQVMEQYHVALESFSSLFSAPMIPAIFFSLIGGLLIDKFGFRGVVGVGLILTAIGCIWRVFSTSYTPLFMAMLLTGFSACFINASSGKIVGSLYGEAQVPAKMGILMAASTGAMTVANLTTAYFPSVRSAFTVSAVFAVVCTVLWFVFIRSPKEDAATAQAEGPGMGECIKVATKSGGVWVIAIALGFIMAANVAIGSYLPTALASRGISETTAGTMAAFYTTGNLLGCFAAPVAIGALKSQKKVLVSFALLAAVGVAFAWTIPNTILLAVALLLTGTCLGGMIPTLMGLPVQFESVGPVYAGTAGGVIGTIQLVGAVVLPSYVIAPIAGGNFSLLYMLAAGCMVIAGVLSLCIREIK